jgi:ABC-type transport system involved in multi-copper enzyme maturation permease subunit
MVGLVLAWGAAVTSFGLALATWNRRPGRALAYSVIVYVGVTVGWIVIVMLMVRGPGGGNTVNGMLIASPWFGSGMLTAEMEERHHNYNMGFPEQWSIVAWSIFWILAYAGAAVVFFLLALFSFNRCLGRMPFYPSQVDDVLRPNLHSAARARAVARQPVRPR